MLQQRANENRTRESANSGDENFQAGP
jgi:hypothetical protein